MGAIDNVKYLYRIFGLASLRQTGRDAALIILARSCRMFAFGTNALVLALFFSSLGFSDPSIGLFLTLTLFGDVFLSLILTLIADRVGRRRVLIGGSVLMIASGATFAVFENFWVLLLAAVFGVISAAGGDFGPFRAIEESMLSQLTSAKTRSDVLTWYVVTSRLGSSVGAEATGRIVNHFEARQGWTSKRAYHAVFWIYSGMGIVNMALCCLLSDGCEAPRETAAEEEDERLMGGEGTEQPRGSYDHEGPANDHDSPATAPLKEKPRDGFMSAFASISRPTRSIMYKLWLLLAVDSLSDGMVSYSLTNYYLDQKFHMSKAALGDITSASYFLACFSSIFAAPLAQFIGLVRTMVFTHLPSSAAVLFFPLPRDVPTTVALLMVRIGLNDMDQAPRTALIAAVVRPNERTAVMGITNMVRTLASSVGPTLTGVLSGSDYFWIAFVVAGTLRIVYDLGLWAIFINVNVQEDASAQDEDSATTPVQRGSLEDEGIAMLPTTGGGPYREP